MPPLGAVRRFADLDETERAQVLATVEGHLASITRPGRASSKDSSTSDEARLIGRSLQLATRRPSDDFIYLVDGQPVIAAWGYEADALREPAGLHAAAVPTIATDVPPRPAARSWQARRRSLPARLRLVALVGRLAVRACCS